MRELIKETFRHARSVLLRPATRLVSRHWALTMLAPLQAEYVAWTDYAMAPAAICTVVNDVVVNSRETVVEFGAGNSTLFVARALAMQGAGHVTSFEHDPEWASHVQRALARWGVADRASVVTAPLSPCDLAREGCTWYSADIVRQRLHGLDVDALIVDGPKAMDRRRRFARWPALPMVIESLSADCSVFLDDVGRSTERQILHEWAELLGARAEIPAQGGGVGVLRRGRRFGSALPR